MITIAEDLKASILQAAIQGKLTEQLASDGDAETLYAAIQKEKQKLIQEGKIKKEKPLPEITEDEIPFDIPENWKWVRLGDVFSVYGGKRIPVGEKWVDYDTGHKYVRVADMKDGTISSADTKYITEDVFQQIRRYTISKDDVYITVAGTIGRVGLVPDEFDRANLTENADKICVYKSDKHFVFYLLSSQAVQTQILDMITQVGQPKLAILRIQNLIFPLPPLAEQKRIVAKVDELMEKVKEIEKSEANIKALYEAFPGDMKASLLQAAIQGKLTEQLASDGDAEDLYKEIQAEKQRLIKEGKIKKEKPLPEITEDEIPFDIPDNWKWVRLTTVCNLIMGSSPNGQTISSTKTPEGIEFHQGKTMFSEMWLCESSSYTSVPTRIAPAMSILMSVRAPVGDVNLTDRDICIGRGLAAIIPYNGLRLDYAFRFLSTKKQDLERISTGSTFKAISKDDVMNILIPLPPLSEQKRIVEKLEQLLPLCDSMKEAIDATT